jgi:hypothetical protein
MAFHPWKIPLPETLDGSPSGESGPIREAYPLQMLMKTMAWMMAFLIRAGRRASPGRIRDRLPVFF